MLRETIPATAGDYLRASLQTRRPELLHTLRAIAKPSWEVVTAWSAEYGVASIESQTGSTLEELARREVFEPLGVPNSRFTWSETDPPPALASGHDATGTAMQRGTPDANAASSLHTTAREYARFIVALLASEGLDPATLLMTPLREHKAAAPDAPSPWAAPVCRECVLSPRHACSPVLATAAIR